jgi:hypothetical protein
MNTKHDLRRMRFERACWWLEQGVSIVPLKPRSKELQPGYGARSAHITDRDFAHKWFLNTDANLGVVLGEPADLIVADWDDMQDYGVWYKTVGATIDTLTERTLRGYHLFFRGSGLTSATGKGCEFKASGVCMVSPSVHPSGTVYQTINDVPIMTIDSDQALTLFPFLSERLPRSGDEGKMTKKARPMSGGVVARIKAVRSILEEMDIAEVKLQRGGRAVLVGLCPFHEDHSPSLWVNTQSGLWGCNKPGCIAAGTHDVINFRALQRGISNREAIKQLVDEFL